MTKSSFFSLLKQAGILIFLSALVINCSGGSSGEISTTQASQSTSGSGGGAPISEPPPNAPPVLTQPLATSIISVENAKQGSDGWQLLNPAMNHEIEGYASLTSVNRGDEIEFFINTAAASYNIDVYRMGYYGGSGARLMQTIQSIERQEQVLPCLNPDGVIECNWDVSQRLRIPNAESNPEANAYWASGVYLAKLSTNTTPVKDSYIIFVVRDDARAAAYVQQLPVTTYQAYNFWGGKSLYTGCETHPNGWNCGPSAPPSPTVSFNRPYSRGATVASAPGIGAGEFLTNVQPAGANYVISNAAWDYNMLRWVERQGYDVKYISNLDLHENSEVLAQAKAFISVGHDEYYSKAMWDRLVGARAAGINLAFFSANQVYWQVRFVPGAYGSNKQNRIMICYRAGGDPVSDNNLTTNQFRYIGRPEASLIGNQYVADPIVGDITISNASHWLFAQTGANNGTVLPGLLGYEVNAYVEGVSPAQTKKLMSSAFTFKSVNMTSDATYYVAPSFAQVFAVGSMQWVWGLDDYIPGNLRADYTNAIAQTFTANVFAAIAEKNLHTLKQAGSDLGLSVPAGDLTGAAVVTNPPPASKDKSQQWRLITSGEANYYYVVSRANGLCLQATGSNIGAQAETSDCRSADPQKWRFGVADAASGKIFMIEKTSGLCLQSSALAGGKLTVESCTSKASQHWLRAEI